MGQVFAPGRVLVDYGPISMVIEASRKGRPMTDTALKGEDTAVDCLNALVHFWDKAKTLVQQLADENDYPPVLKKMIEAARETGEPDVTPMVAVAGTIAEFVLVEIARRGATRIIVNNGGDIAFRMEKGGSVRVGVVTDLPSQKVSHYINLKSELGLGGIATSGFGGRSFTKGIASAVMVLATSASIADACATMVANAVNADDPEISRRLAENLDPLTDIKGQWVTEKVGRLNRSTVEKAIESGREKFFKYRNRGLLYGAVIAVQGQVWAFPEEMLKKL